MQNETIKTAAELAAARAAIEAKQRELAVQAAAEIKALREAEAAAKAAEKAAELASTLAAAKTAEKAYNAAQKGDDEAEKTAAAQALAAAYRAAAAALTPRAARATGGLPTEIRPPRDANSIIGQLWAAYDSGKTPAELIAGGVNANTVKTQYYKWRVYNGVAAK